MRLLFKCIRIVLWLSLLGIFIVGATVGGAILYFNPELPTAEDMKDARLQIPLKIYSADNKLIAQFGEKRRTPIKHSEVPPLFIQAVYAAEDDSFESHFGIDIKSLTRAAIELILSGEIKSGGSTITMQVARNYFLDEKRSFRKKFKEILLAFRIERHFTKQEILELYFNKIFLGNRAYGIQAAAQVYYGKPIDQLELPQLAMIAGLPKGPSICNPISSPDCAKGRRNWILGRMLKLEYIDQTQYEEAINSQLTAQYHGPTVELNAPYIAEMVRRKMAERYGNHATTDGYRVFTTIDSRLQDTATQSLRENLLNYSKRHGYRGPEIQHPDNTQISDDDWLIQLKNTPIIGGLQPAIVKSIEEKQISVLLRNGETTTIEWDQLKWAKPYINTNRYGHLPKSASDIVSTNDLIRVHITEVEIKQEENSQEASELENTEQQTLTQTKMVVSLAQIPEAQGALVSLNPKDGAILSLVGGFDFDQSKFNRVTQAKRQPGSNFKPFLYTAALTNGYTAASIINDAPIVIEDLAEEELWRPQNSGGSLGGPTRLRKGLYLSRNLVSIRLLREISIPVAKNYIKQFGFSAESMPNNLTLALGTGLITPLELVSGYAAIANGGFKVSPHLISRIEDSAENIVFLANPATACDQCDSDNSHGLNQAEYNPSFLNKIVPFIQQRKSANRIIDKETAYIIDSILKDVVRLGTGRRALALKRSDIAGKTGTTNDQVDAWFSGYNGNIVTTAWVGFDEPLSLGRKEFGAVAALPMWMKYMEAALAGTPETEREMPDSMIKVRIDPNTGLRAHEQQSDAIVEVFTKDTAPPERQGGYSDPYATESGTYQTPEQLF